MFPCLSVCRSVGLVVIFAAVGTAIAAGTNAFSALLADRTSEKERPRVLSVVWAMRLLGVVLGTVLVNQVFGSACDAGASRASVLSGLDRLTLVAPLLLLNSWHYFCFGRRETELRS